MRTATAAQLESIRDSVGLIQDGTNDWGLTNTLHVVFTHLEPGLRPNEIGWMCSILMFEMESAGVRGYTHLMPCLRGVVDALYTVQSDLTGRG